MSNSKLDHVRTLFIDLDGTLIQQSKNVLTPFKFLWKIFPKLQLPNQSLLQNWKNIKQGGHALQAGHEDSTNFARLISVFEKNGSLSKQDAEKLVLDSLNFAYPSLKSLFKPMDGAANFIEWAKDHYTLILTTNPVWPLELVKERMVWGNINPDYFKRITTSDQMNYCKPAPEFYRQLLTQEKLNPQECLMIGNEEKMDLPATKAGIPVFLIDQALNRPFTLLEPSSTSPGAWKGNYGHLRAFLTEM